MVWIQLKISCHSIVTVGGGWIEGFYHTRESQCKDGDWLGGGRRIGSKHLTNKQKKMYSAPCILLVRWKMENFVHISNWMILCSALTHLYTKIKKNSIHLLEERGEKRVSRLKGRK